MRTRRLLGLGAAFMCACALALAMTATAFAASTFKVTGINNNEPSDAATAILTVQQASDQATGEDAYIYVDVYKVVDDKDQIIAKRLPVKVDTKGSPTNTGVVSIDIPTANAAGLKIVAFDGEGKSATSLYTGTIHGVYANVEGLTNPKLLGTRTTTATGWDKAEMRSFVPVGSFSENGVHYKLDLDADGNPIVTKDAANNLFYSYSQYSPEATATGTIKFVNQADGKELDMRTYVGIKTGQEVKVSIPTTVANKNDQSDPNVYRTLFTPGGYVTLKNPSSLDYVIECSAAGSSFDPTFHIVTVKFVSGDKTLATDKVSVSGDFKYTVPQSIEQEYNGVYTKYVLAKGSESVIDLSNPELNEVKVYYTAQEHTQDSIDVTYVEVDATKRANDPNKVIKTEDAKTVTAAQPTATPEPTATLSTGEQYVLAGDVSQYTYTYGNGGATTIYAYYVPENYTPPKPYPVNVKYVNLADNSVIDTASYTASDTNADLVINVPANIAKSGENYVRLDGQGDTIRHNFFSGEATYTVYYRNVNDNLTKNVVITRINVVYDTVTGTAGTAGTTTATLPGGGELTAINTPEGGTVTTPGGTDAQTIREIGDNENPLAAANNANKGFSIEKDWPLIAGGVCLLAALAIIIAVIANKRKRQANEAAAGNSQQ